MSLTRLIKTLRKAVDSAPAKAARGAYDWYGEPGEHGRARARDAQRPPAGAWKVWLILAGRGWGKTRTAAEWVRRQVETGQARRVALVGATAADTRDVIIEGESGLLSVCPPWNRPVYEPSKRRLTWPNGAVATAYSADEPERLRGPQHDLAYLDEVGSWRRPAAFDNLMLGLRLGEDPRAVVSTTPRPTELVRSLLAAPSTVKTGGNTYENAANLARSFIEEIGAKYEGTRLGRQEIHAELLENLEGAWFHSFNPARHVSVSAEYNPTLPVRLAIDCGTSRDTGAVFFQTREVAAYRTVVTVFGDYHQVDLFSEGCALAIKALAGELCRGRIDLVRLDPASTAKTGVGPAALGEYQRVFNAGNRRIVEFWPQHQVLDGLDQIELLLGPETREPDLLIHPRCVHLIAAFNGYVRAQRAGQWVNFPASPMHPHEDLLDALRGGVRDALPEGRTPQPSFRRVHWSRAF